MPKKRSIASASSAGQFPQSVRMALEKIYGKHCFGCSHNRFDMAHVISKKDGSQPVLRARGLLNFNVRSKLNAVPLCRNCHDAYDDAIDPTFVFWPTDLDFFIRFEVRDRVRRERERAEGRQAARRVPTAHQYERHQEAFMLEEGKGGLYYRLYMDPDCTNDQAASDPIKQWHGSPIAAIRRAILIIGCPRIAMVPMQVVVQLQILRDLYFRDDEEEVENIHGLRGYRGPDGEIDTMIMENTKNWDGDEELDEDDEESHVDEDESPEKKVKFDCEDAQFDFQTWKWGSASNDRVPLLMGPSGRK